METQRTIRKLNVSVITIYVKWWNPTKEQQYTDLGLDLLEIQRKFYEIMLKDMEISQNLRIKEEILNIQITL